MSLIAGKSTSIAGGQRKALSRRPTPMQIETANAERLALDAAALAPEPPPPVDYVRWAEDNITFSERESPFPGPYNRTMFPYFDEPLRALSASRPRGSRDAFCVRPVCRQGRG